MSVPLFANKYGKPSLLDPSAFVDYHRTEGAYRDQPTPRAAILCYHRGFAEHVLARCPGRCVPGFFGDTYLLDDSHGQIALVANFGIGSPVAAVMLEDLIALGASHVVSIGTTGALQPDMSVGDVIVVDGAFRDEGTSYHYLPAGEQVRADPTLRSLLERTLNDRGIPYRVGDVWTTDGVYRETLEEVRHYTDAGALAVEMEAAALFAVAASRAAQVASLLAVSDSLADPDGWKPSFHADETLRALDTVFDIAYGSLTQALLHPVSADGDVEIIN